MAQKRYSKKKLAFFKKHIQSKLDALTSDLDNSRDSLCAGSFSVTITDNNGNLVDFRSNQIEEPSELGIFKTIIKSCFFERKSLTGGIINSS